MTGRDWDKELASIDKQLSSLSDADLLTRAAPATAGANAGTSAPATAGTPRSASPWWTGLGVTLAVALAIGVPLWPYGRACGTSLVGYMGSVGVTILAGAWAARGTWRARWGRPHVVALLVTAWGIALGAIEVLPRIGYAQDASRSEWLCSGPSSAK